MKFGTTIVGKRCKWLVVTVAVGMMFLVLLYLRLDSIETTIFEGGRKSRWELCDHEATAETPTREEPWDSEIKRCPDGGQNPYENQSEAWHVFREALDRYKKFHRAQVRVLRDTTGGVNYESRKRELPKTLIWTCNYGSCGGLGDQLPRITLFLLMAMISDRVLIISWDEGYQRTVQYLLPNEIEWTYFDESLGMCRSADNSRFNHCSEVTFSKTSATWDSWSQEDWAKFGRALFSSEPHITVIGRVNLGSMMIANSEFVEPNTLMRARLTDIGVTEILTQDSSNKIDFTYSNVWFTSTRMWYTASWFYMTRMIFHFLFRVSPVITSEAAKVERAIGLHNRKYLAVHLRTGFMGTSYQKADKISTWNYKNWKMFPDQRSWEYIMDHAVDFATEKLGADSLIYFATDSTVARDWVLETYGKRIRTANMTITHSARLTEGCEDSKGFIDFWIDFYLLARAYYIVHGSSSFALSASMVCATPPLRHSWVSYDDDSGVYLTHVGTNTTRIS